MTTNPYASLCRKYPHMCKFPGTIPSNQLQYAKVPFWNNIQIPLSKHTWEIKIIAIWNTKGRVCLNAHNKDVLQSIAKAIRQSPSPIRFFKVKFHAGIIGNEHAEALAKKSATTYSDLADTSIKTAGPEGNPLYNIHWLAKVDIEKQTQTHYHTHTTNMAHSSPPKLWYLPNHRDALQARMHFLHILGNVKTEANYHAYNQTLITDGTANEVTSNAYLTSSDVPFKTKCIIMK